MRIETIKLRDFRNYTYLELQPHPGVNLLFGQNGSGKTNLLEAIHYCALGRSHRTSLDREVVRKGAEMGACGVTVQRADGRCEVSVKLTPGEVKKKQVFIDRKRALRLSQLMGRVQCVIFSPEDLQLIREGPAIRRRYVDMLLSQISPGYFIALQQYQKALEQRNAMLRDARKTGRLPTDMMEAFEHAMAQPCETIIPLRRKMIAKVASIAGGKYGAISGREGEHFTMSYDTCLPEAGSITAQVQERLRQSRQEDMLRGTTCFGIHREDIALRLNDREMKLFASQGQVRTAALSMKLSQMEIFQQETGDRPILLLDDVMSELDMTRRTHLLEEIQNTQTFVTCTDESDLEGCHERRSYRVSLMGGGAGCIQEIHEGESIASVPEEEPDFT